MRPGNRSTISITQFLHAKDALLPLMEPRLPFHSPFTMPLRRRAFSTRPIPHRFELITPTRDQKMTTRPLIRMDTAPKTTKPFMIQETTCSPRFRTLPPSELSQLQCFQFAGVDSCSSSLVKVAMTPSLPLRPSVTITSGMTATQSTLEVSAQLKEPELLGREPETTSSMSSSAALSSSH